MRIKWTIVGLQKAYGEMNESLFDGRLPECIIRTADLPYIDSAIIKIDNSARLVTPPSGIQLMEFRHGLVAEGSAEEVLICMAHEQVHVWRHRSSGLPPEDPKTGGHDDAFIKKAKEMGLLVVPDESSNIIKGGRLESFIRKFLHENSEGFLGSLPKPVSMLDAMIFGVPSSREAPLELHGAPSTAMKAVVGWGALIGGLILLLR